MSDNPAFFRARADHERAAADAATLDNVRDRCDRAARAWAEMADRAERTQSLRLTREAATAAARDAANDDSGMSPAMVAAGQIDSRG
jgi:histidinol dehydrogenase